MGRREEVERVMRGIAGGDLSPLITEDTESTGTTHMIVSHVMRMFKFAIVNLSRYVKVTEVRHPNPNCDAVPTPCYAAMQGASNPKLQRPKILAAA